LTGEGLDGGVVYAELQATENSAEDKSTTELVKLMYPASSGYHYQAGGMCKDVRENCNNDRVRFATRQPHWILHRLRKISISS